MRLRFLVSICSKPFHIWALLTSLGADEVGPAAIEQGFGGNADWEVSGASAGGAFAAASATAGAAAPNWDAAAATGEDWAAAPGTTTEWGAATTGPAEQW
jgi:small subunit ribosomal protein SAe